ncbi:MAG: YfcE family phosphodiesterase [Ruminococcus sp.]|nr:YfcE family phosphodiesterase [Ruminococcus sp.]
MRIIVMSDSHGHYSPVEKIVRRNLDADMFIHLGDGEADVDAVIRRYPEIASRFVHVKGNCDVGSLSENVYTMPVGGHKIYASHGHLQGVKYSLEHIKKIAAANDCDIVLFGHTHVRHTSYDNGMYLMNPGSASRPNDGKPPSFGCVDITDAGVITHVTDI